MFSIRYKTILYIFIIFIMIFGAYSLFDFILDQPKSTSIPGQTVMESEVYATEPEQINTNERPFSYKNSTLYPKATYKIKGKIVAEKYYDATDIATNFSPLDIGLVWGDISKEKFLKRFNFSIENRQLSTQYNSTAIRDANYVITHVSNNHIIPASDNVLKGIQQAKIGDIIYLEGELVDVKTIGKDENEYLFNTSLTRDDTNTGDNSENEGNSCEVIYVKAVVVNNYIYQ